MEKNAHVRNQVVEAKRKMTASLLFVCLDNVYQIELDEQGERIELGMDECEFNQQALEILRNTTMQFKKLYVR